MQEKANNAPTRVSTRRYTTKKERLSHVEKWKSSGLSMSEYCRQNTLPLANLSEWKNTLLRKGASFKPVKILSSQDASVQPGSIVEIIVDNRIKIRLQHITNALLVINIAKGLMTCS